MSGIPRSLIHRHYTFALLLAAGLFALHTGVLYEAAYWGVALHKNMSATVSAHAISVLMILGCFLLLFIAHIAEAAAWGLFFWRTKLLPTFSESFYFSLTSMTALGYGDVVLQFPWRLLGPLVAVNGLLMFGCSTAFLFLMIEKIWLNVF